ncbi:hypothetical protein [Bradyrhizobium sp. Cp5.3]|uniref:hypothetical protein n=1 Tax=Bradyrhizobium sp. Cp5.3 TaxID=443598 RepID=UPI00041F7D5E|nr:hypothetical protein [Bradyrhizobium sp. Cp5.3]
MSSRFGAIFSGTLALVLLALYCSSALYLIFKVYAWGACASPSGYEGGYIYVLTTVGGLVSALVIAQLSVTKPGTAPTIGGTAPESNLGIYATNTVVGFYLFAWVFTGLAALIVGVMICTDPANGNKTITDLGTTWLGLAVTAAYAYFGIQPGGRGGEDKKDDKGDPATPPVAEQLKKEIADKQITFDAGRPELESELLRENPGIRISERLQSLVLELAKASPDPILIREMVRMTEIGPHSAGRAVDIGRDVAGKLLPLVATAAKAGELQIDEIIFDAGGDSADARNKWNFKDGVKFSYDETTLNNHKTRIHFSVAS